MAKTGKILVVGGDGMIGHELASLLAARDHEIVCTSRSNVPNACRLDLNSEVSSSNVPKDVEIAYLCAAVTSLEHCRLHPTETRAVNVSATARVAEILVRQGTFVVFLSSNLVFDGSTPLIQSAAPTNPRVEYGRQKADAERLLLQMGDRCSVVRLTKVLCRGNRLLCGWRDAVLAGRAIHPFSDMVMAPISLSFAVEAIAAVGSRKRGGVVQVSAKSDISYAEAARYIADRIVASADLVAPIRAGDSKTDMEWIPQHTSLDTAVLSTEFGLSAPDPWDAIDQAIQS